MSDNLGREITSAYKALIDERLPFEQLWEEAFRYTYPIRGQQFQRQGSVDGISIALNAKRDQAVIFDTTASDSARLLASSMISGLTPSNSQWFNLTIPKVKEDDVPHDVKEWLESSANTIFTMIHNSNYDCEAFEFFLDMVIGGICGLFVDMVDGELVFEFWPLDTMYVQQTLNRKRIDTVYRACEYTAAAAVKTFGVKNLPDNIVREYNSNPASCKKFKFIHCIRPRLNKAGKQSNGKIQKTFPFESIYVCEKSNTVIKESGFHEFPVIIPRWLKMPKTNYATGPIDSTLPDIKTLNRIVQMVLTNGEMAIAGTFVAKDDGVINPSTMRIGPRRILFAADPNNIKPLASGGDFRVASMEIERLQRAIRRVMMSDQLQPQDGPTMTATEVHVRVNLIRQLLGPIYGRFQAEYLAPLIERVFGLALRGGYLGQPPEAITQYEFQPQYQSPLARAQRRESVQAIVEFEAMLGQTLNATQDPSVLDLYDVDKAVRTKGEMLGVPVELFRSIEEVNQLREERSAQLQNQNMQEMAATQGPQPGPESEISGDMSQELMQLLQQ